MTPDEIKKVLRLHSMWLAGEGGGICADLRGVNLRGANLEFAHLRGANLRGVNLRDANLRGVNLRGVNLRDANLQNADLQCFGDRRYVKTMQIGEWYIGYTYDMLQIGCQRHEIDKWRRWNTEAGRKWIAQMDNTALEWAEKHLDLILQMIDASPAEPTGYKE